jgi:hypothetical protein
MDSGRDLRGLFYKSGIQITSRGAFVYEVAARPNGDGHFRVWPRDVPLRGDEGYTTVEIPYWQHKDDELYEAELASQSA